MLFNSYVFLLLFLPLTILGYYVLHYFNLHKLSLIYLCIMSFIFYGYNNEHYVWILGTSIIGNWIISNFMKKIFYKRFLLVGGILFNISFIFYFKYFNFFLSNMNYLVKTSFELRNIVLPLGISFFTFQQVSYLIDTYRGETDNYTFIEYATFVAFFPQLVAGPIVLHREIIPQFQMEKKYRFSHNNFANGLYDFAIGLFKKVLIADTFGLAVTWGWNNIEAMTSAEIAIVMISYTFQIYFDFSGYSDMAIGLGKMLNIDLPLNFDSPYKATSILEFWNRWHLTLNRFLRNYLYFPLGGSRKGKINTHFNVLLVFLVSGIWHGANWTFILWGIVHGCANVLNRIFREKWDKMNKGFCWICTFVFVNFTWLIFRSDNIKQAFGLMKRLLGVGSLTISRELKNCFVLEEINYITNEIFKGKLVIDELWMWVFLGGAMFVCLCLPNIHEKEFKPTKTKAIVTAVLLIWSIVSFAGISTFLYFNF